MKKLLLILFLLLSFGAYSQECQDTDNGAVDSYGYSCEMNAGYCYGGAFDDDDFNEMEI